MTRRGPFQVGAGFPVPARTLIMGGQPQPLSNVQTAQVAGNTFDFKPLTYYQKSVTGGGVFDGITGLSGNGFMVSTDPGAGAGIAVGSVSLNYRLYTDTWGPVLPIFHGNVSDMILLGNPLFSVRGLPYQNFALVFNIATTNTVTIFVTAFTDYANDNLGSV